jgi:hypothetical protein
MWHGDKQLDHPLPASRDQSGTRWLAAAVLCVAALMVALVISLGA